MISERDNAQHISYGVVAVLSLFRLSRSPGQVLQLWKRGACSHTATTDIERRRTQL